MSLIVRDLRRSRKTYSFSRKEPVTITVSPGVGPHTFFAHEEIDISRYAREYDLFARGWPLTAQDAMYVSTGSFLMAGGTQKSHAFPVAFLGTPVITVEASDYYGNNESNIATYIVSRSPSEFMVGTSASFTGEILYKAVWFNGPSYREGYIGAVHYTIEKNIIQFSNEESKYIPFTRPFASLPGVTATPIETGSHEVCVKLYLDVSLNGFTVSTNRPFTGAILFQALLY